MCGNTTAGVLMDKVRRVEEIVSGMPEYETNPAMLRFFSPQLGNPDAKYGGIMIKNDYPRWLCEWLGETLCGNTLTIERDEAVVIYMCTPPESQYWSIAAYNMIRTSNYKLEIPGAELSRPISQDWLKTSGDSVWEKPVLFILSGSSRTTKLIERSTILASIPINEINIITLPRPETDNLRYRNRNQPLLWNLPDLLQVIVRLQGVKEGVQREEEYYSTTWAGFSVRPLKPYANPESFNQVSHTSWSTSRENFQKGGGLGYTGRGSLPSLTKYVQRLENVETELKAYMKNTHGMEYIASWPMGMLDFNYTRCIHDGNYDPTEGMIDKGRAWVGTRCMRSTSDATYLGSNFNSHEKVLEGSAIKEGRVWAFYGVDPFVEYGDFYWNIMVTSSSPDMTPASTMERKENLVTFSSNFLKNSAAKAGISDSAFWVGLRGNPCPPKKDGLCLQAIDNFVPGWVHPIYRLYCVKSVKRPPLEDELDYGNVFRMALFEPATLDKVKYEL